MKIILFMHLRICPRLHADGENMPAESKEENASITWLDQHGDTLYRFARARVRDSFAAEDLV